MSRFTICHKSEVVKNTLNPVWQAFSIPVRALCNGDYERWDQRAVRAHARCRSCCSVELCPHSRLNPRIASDGGKKKATEKQQIWFQKCDGCTRFRGCRL